MKRKLLWMNFLAAFLFVAMLLTGCASKKHYVVNTEGTLYSKLEQKIQILLEEDQGAFQESISKKDLTLSDDLKGKTVDEVTFVSTKEIEVVISGSLEKTTENSYEYCLIQITGGMGRDTAEALVTVMQSVPKVASTSYSIYGPKTGKTCSSRFTLPYGSWNKDISNYITVKNNNGTVSEVSMVDSSLTVTISNFVSGDNENYPVILISEAGSSFHIPLELTVGAFSEAELA